MNVFSQRSERVKGVDIHPTEPWILASLYNGNVYIWNYVEGALVKSFEITDLPVRTAKFIPRKQWMVCGADDMHVRVYNYNTMDKVKQFEAHTDYIRHLAVHPTLPYLLTCSDDMLIKLWDWEKGWVNTQVFEGHSHYVMHVVFNPKDPNTFASASLDRTVWGIGSHMPNFTLEGHEKGVNCVDYYTGGDRPYLASGADDRLVKVWDYQTKACIQTLDGHAHNITAVGFHPELPLLLTGSEDGSVKAWHSTTYRLEHSLDHGMERVWAVAYTRGSNSIAIGYDEGCVMVKLGRDEPVASMDAGGKVVWARHNEIQTVNIKSLGDAHEEKDGERLPLAVKDLGSSEQYPQYLAHSPNGRFVAVCGDGEYVIYTALAWRNKAFGAALDFAWSDDSNTFAIRESSTVVKIFRNFKEAQTLRLPYSAEGIHGGSLLGVRTPDAITFYDWAGGAVVRRIEAEVRAVHWSEGGAGVALVGPAATHILEYSREAAEAALASGEGVDEDGVESAFELVGEIGEPATSAVWVGDCLAFTTSSWRIAYAVGGETTTLAHADRPLYLLGYLAAAGRLYAVDRAGAVVAYTLLLPVVEFKTRVLRGDVDGARALLPTVPEAEHAALARFLEARGHLEAAAEVATDPAHRFDLALALGRLDSAAALAAESGSALAWRALGEAALAAGDLGAALLARTYRPSRAGEVVVRWQADLARANPKAAEALANPDDYPNLFPGWSEALEAERAVYGAVGAGEEQGVGMGAGAEEAGVDEGADSEEAGAGAAPAVGAAAVGSAIGLASGPIRGAKEAAASNGAPAAGQAYAFHDDPASAEEEAEAFGTEAEGFVGGGSADWGEEPEAEAPVVEAPALAPAVRLAPEEEDELSAALGALTPDEEALLAEEGLDDEDLAGFGDADEDGLDEGAGDFSDDWGLDEGAKRD
ncbi:Coatomer subunit beta'-1 [Auxenochlorella protothecoides]|uniref:Beta'-coat protein n=1 Tax=Auxenochlorella protothecoides TaxID=3075 RepID=A0A087SDS0_AUXPR|nr:Coatomer subunit beta'-1 [Auxenochlorella protothecoides]KFM23874.1 Coatomer subunit beta'-1 [Auxenochlorella protothecoides]